MKISTITNRFVRKYREHKRVEQKITDKIEQRRKQVERLEKKLQRHGYGPHWTDEIIKPIAEEMIKHMPDRTYEILGPFGLGARTSIHFIEKGVSKKDQFLNDNCRSITFEPGNIMEDDGEILLVDYSRNTNRFPPGSIGDMNGFNHPTVPIKKTIKELVDSMAELSEHEKQPGGDPVEPINRKG